MSAASTAGLVALIGVHIATLTTLALRAHGAVDSEAVAMGYLFAMVVLGLSAFPCAALTGSVGLLALRSSALPRWFGRLSLGSTMLWLLAGVSAASEHDVWARIFILRSGNPPKRSGSLRRSSSQGLLSAARSPSLQLVEVGF